MQIEEMSSLEQLLAVANSVHGPGAHKWPSRQPDDSGHDHLTTPQEARAFLKEEHLEVPLSPLSNADLLSLRRLRTATWALLEQGGDEKSRQSASALLRNASYRLEADGTLTPLADRWPRFVASLLPALLQLQEEAHKLKVCRDPTCGWLFLDRTKNGSRVWCDMAACGNRAKVGRFMRRRSAGPPRPEPARSRRRPASVASPRA